MATQIRRPTSDISATLTPSSGTANWDMVDETPHDSDTTYVSATAFKTDIYGTSAFSISASSVTKVTVYNVNRYATGTVADGAFILRVNSITYSQAPTAMTGSYALYSSDWLTNPNSSVAWTQEDVNGTSASPYQGCGVNHRNQDGESRTTQNYAEVTYVEAVIKGNPSLMLTGLGK